MNSSFVPNVGHLRFFPIEYYTRTDDNARAVIGQYLLTIIPVNHMENVVII